MEFLRLDCEREARTPLEICTSFKAKTLSKAFKQKLNLIKTLLADFVYSHADIDHLPEKLPLIAHELNRTDSETLSFSVLALKSEKISLADFLFDFFRFYLLEGKAVFPADFQHLEFHFSHLEDLPLFFGHLTISLSNEQEFDLVAARLSYVLDVLKRALISPEYARKILDFEMEFPDRRGNQVQEHLQKIICRQPSNSPSLWKAAHLLFSLTGKTFRDHRTSKGLSRIISSLAFMQRRLEDVDLGEDKDPELVCRLFPLDVEYSFGTKRVLGLCIGVKHLSEHQLLHQACILQAVSHHVPEAKMVQGSYLFLPKEQEGMRLIYLELEKQEGDRFSLEERRLLKNELKQSLIANIEQVVPSVFMLRNEEEIIKNIMTLRGEVNSIDDVPQVIISLEEYSVTHLTFVITMVCIQEKSDKSLPELLETLEDPWTFIHDRQKVLSQDGDEFTKEAHVFRLRLRKSPEFSRSDASVNVHHAHEIVVEFLKEKLGAVRDYTGGIIVLQNNLFSQLRDHYREQLDKCPKLFEDLFYSFSPVDKMVTLSMETLLPLFDYTLALVNGDFGENENYVAKKSELKECVYLVVRLKNSVAEAFHARLKGDGSFHEGLMEGRVRWQGFVYLAYMFRSGNEADSIAFSRHAEKCLEASVREDQSKQVLHLPLYVFPASLDPRLTMQTSTNEILKFLFDGLMRIGADGQPYCSVADSFTFSEDKKTYTFHLKETYWNNGDPVTAHDFVYAWKKVLSPNFNTPFAYLFFLIRNAKEAKLGKCPLEKVGVHVKDGRTLVVELEQPAAHFLHYLALNIFYPINQKVEELHPDWPHQFLENFPCNGPFMLKSVSPGKHLQLIKNSRYRDETLIRLNHIHMSVGSLEALFEHYQKEKLDWLGVPFTGWENHFEQCQGEKYSTINARINWVSVNTERHLLSNKKFRQAIYFALDRAALVRHLDAKGEPAGSVLPPLFSALDPSIDCSNPQKAQNLYQEALEELKIPRGKKLKLTLGHPAESFPIREGLVIEMQNQLKKVLDLDLDIRVVPWSIFREKMIQGDYDLFFLSWYYFVNTPFYFLDSLQPPEHKSLYHWTHQKFEQALKEAKLEEDIGKQKDKIAQVERILCEECPIIPIYYSTESYVKNPRFKGFSVDERLGLFDFNRSYFKSMPSHTEKFIKWCRSS